MTTYTDLLIENDDISTDAAGQPLLIHDRDVIAQDVRHAVRESGLLLQLVGERNAQRRALVRKKIRQVVESDSRIKPGTSTITEYFASTTAVQLSIQAESEFGLITIGA